MATVYSLLIKNRSCTPKKEGYVLSSLSEWTENVKTSVFTGDEIVFCDEIGSKLNVLGQRQKRSVVITGILLS